METYAQSIIRMTTTCEHGRCSGERTVVYWSAFAAMVLGTRTQTIRTQIIRMVATAVVSRLNMISL